MDTVTRAKRSETMAAVRSRGNRSTELRMVELFRKHGITGWRRGVLLPGKPDFVFRAARVAVFVDGCFWHGCPRHARVPKTRTEFWMPKLARNKARDRVVSRTLRAEGWIVLRVWECALTPARENRTASRIAAAIKRGGERTSHASYHGECISTPRIRRRNG